MKTGFSTNAFTKFSLPETIEMIADIGYEGLEIVVDAPHAFLPLTSEKLKQIKPGKGNEFQLADAIQELISSGEKVLAIPLLEKEKVLDVGTVESYMESQITSFRYA